MSKQNALQTLAAHGAKFAHAGAPKQAAQALPGVVTSRKFKAKPLEKAAALAPESATTPEPPARRDMESGGYAVRD